jgi:acetyl-CoA acetyltransferase
MPARSHARITAENIAERHDITREMQDALAVESHRRAAQAQSEGRFDSQIVPVQIKSRGTVKSFDRDEHLRSDVDAAGLAALAPVFRKEKGTVTAGNASGLNDGGAALVLASGDEATRLHAKCRPNHFEAQRKAERIMMISGWNTDKARMTHLARPRSGAIAPFDGAASTADIMASCPGRWTPSGGDAPLLRRAPVLPFARHGSGPP